MKNESNACSHFFQQPMLKQLKQVHVSGSHFLINKGSQSNKRNEILFMRFVRQTNQIARVPACCSQNQSCLLVFACGFCFVSLMFFDYLSSSQLQSQVFYLRNTLLGLNRKSQKKKSYPGISTEL